MANYANKYFKEYVLRESLKAAILSQKSVSDNPYNVKKLGTFLRDILKEKHEMNEQNMENVSEKLQRKTLNLMSPLSKIWNILEGAKRAEQDSLQIFINDLLHHIGHAILLHGRSSNAITYHTELKELL